MFVITADQVDSRSDVDRAQAMIATLTAGWGEHLVLPIDQTAGDEIQIITSSADAALSLVLELARSGRWSIGLGIGDVRRPLPDAARKATGGAFIAARAAVDAAKRADARFALRTATVADSIGPDDVEPILRMLLLIRARRTAQGWEVVDLVSEGRSQKEAAAILGISAAAVSMRLKTALWSVDEDARPAIVRLLREVDAATSDSSDPTNAAHQREGQE